MIIIVPHEGSKAIRSGIPPPGDNDDMMMRYDYHRYLRILRMPAVGPGAL